MSGKYFSAIIFLFLTIPLSAQNNMVKLGGGVGSVPYEGTPGWNIELQYERKIISGFFGFLALGINGDHFTSRGRSQGSSGGTSWDNSYQYSYSERLPYIDIGLRCQIFRIKEKYKLKLAVGGSLVQSDFKYPEYIFINRGIIEQIDMTKHKVEVGMVLLGIDNYISLTNKIGLNVAINYRTAFREKYILRREVTYHNGSSSNTSGILDAVNIAVMFTYSW